ncbi:tail fiber protein [Xanthobacteraceae bacterium A53D]
MPDDASGTYFLPSSYFVQSGDTVLPSQHNPPFEDVASAMSNRLHADGRRSWEGNQNAGGKRITNLGDGVANSDAATVAQAVAASAPIGSIIDYAGATAPARYMFCNGQALSRTDYATLFAVLGTAFGAGNGSTTFNLPDFRGRVSAGKDNMGGTTAGRLTAAGSGITGTTLGAAGGSQTHTLTTAQLAAHNHTASTNSTGAHNHTATATAGGAHTHAASASSAGAHTHSGTAASAGAHTHTGSSASAGAHAHTGTTSSAGEHTHDYMRPQLAAPGPIIQVGNNLGSLTIPTSPAGAHTHTFTTGSSGAHSHDITVASGGAHTHEVTTVSAGAHAHDITVTGIGNHTHTVTTESAGAHSHTVTVVNSGSGAAHNNTQPTIILNKIIRVS